MKIEETVSFCPNCGTAQPRSANAPPRSSAAPQYTDMLDSISDRTASILCYIPVFGIIPSIVFLASQKFRHNARVRFDAFQSVYLFVAWLIISSALPVFILGLPGWGVERGLLGAVKLFLFGCWIYLLIKASQREQVRLPVIGDLAARSTSEQL